jgi:hypothetical protein
MVVKLVGRRVDLDEPVGELFVDPQLHFEKRRVGVGEAAPSLDAGAVGKGDDELEGGARARARPPA